MFSYYPSTAIFFAGYSNIFIESGMFAISHNVNLHNIINNKTYEKSEN